MWEKIWSVDFYFKSLNKFEFFILFLFPEQRKLFFFHVDILFLIKFLSNLFAFDDSVEDGYNQFEYGWLRTG